jgi:hypothetical protein
MIGYPKRPFSLFDTFKDTLYVAPGLYEKFQELPDGPDAIHGIDGTITLPGGIQVIKCDYLEPGQIVGDPKIIKAIMDSRIECVADQEAEPERWNPRRIGVMTQ